MEEECTDPHPFAFVRSQAAPSSSFSSVAPIGQAYPFLSIRAAGFASRYNEHTACGVRRMCTDLNLSAIFRLQASPSSNFFTAPALCACATLSLHPSFKSSCEVKGWCHERFDDNMPILVQLLLLASRRPILPPSQ